MTTRILCAVLALVVGSTVAQAEPPSATCDLPAERGVCRSGGQRTGTLRLIEKARRKRYLESLRSDASVNGGLTVTATTEKGNTIVLTAGELRRRTSLEVYAGEPGPKDGTLRLGLKLEDADGGTLCAGEATFDLVNGPFDADYVTGASKCDLVRSIQAYPTKEPGRWAFAFVATGEAAAKVARGTVTASAIGRNGKEVVSTTPFDGAEIVSERAYAAEVVFDGDPVGRTVALELLVTKDGTPIERTKTTLEVMEIPACDGGMRVVGFSAPHHVGETRRHFSLSKQIELWQAP